MLLGLGIAVLVLAADQLSKLYVAGHLLNGRGVIMVGDYFNIVTAWNTGVSFSMFNNWGIWGTICLSLIYINCDTGDEEDIMLLLNSENGTLVK